MSVLKTLPHCLLQHLSTITPSVTAHQHYHTVCYSTSALPHYLLQHISTHYHTVCYSTSALSRCLLQHISSTTLLLQYISTTTLSVIAHQHYHAVCYRTTASITNIYFLPSCLQRCNFCPRTCISFPH